MANQKRVQMRLIAFSLIMPKYCCGTRLLSVTFWGCFSADELMYPSVVGIPQWCVVFVRLINLLKPVTGRIPGVIGRNYLLSWQFDHFLCGLSLCTAYFYVFVDFNISYIVFATFGNSWLFPWVLGKAPGRFGQRHPRKQPKEHLCSPNVWRHGGHVGRHYINDVAPGIRH